jgi:hypothetical protein
MPNQTLSNYGTLVFENVTSAVQQNPLSAYPNINITMVDPSGNTMATASGLENNGYSCTDGQNSCR